MLRFLFGNPRRDRPPSASEASPIALLLLELNCVAPKAGLGAYGFSDERGSCLGWMQFIVESPRCLIIHRLWTNRCSAGFGTRILRTVCELADRHGVELRLKAIPFGRKPHPLTRQQLIEWYGRYGFEGKAGSLRRRPSLLPTG